MILRPCEYCSKPVKVSPSKEHRHTYCSRVCFQASRNTEYTCETCGKVFTAQKILRGRKRYCSKQCKNKGNVPLKEYRNTCAVCGSPFTIIGSWQRRNVTCSRACANQARATASAKRNNRINRSCAMCGKSFQVFPSRTTKYCSRECTSKATIKRQTGKRRSSQQVRCEYCGKLTHRYTSRVNHYDRAFCNAACFHAWDAIYKATPDMIARLSHRLRDGFGKPSGLEDRVANWLDLHGLSFHRQVLLKVYTIDFLVGSTYIEVQGCYWHGCIVCNKELTPRQRQRAARDKSLATYCRKRGIPLLCIWEHDIDHGDYSALMPLLGTD